MLFIIVVGALSAFEILNLLRQAGNKTFKTILGYVWIPEIILSIGLPALAALTGTISGVVIAAFSGFMITMALMVAKKVVGTRKYVKNETTGKREWVEYEGTLTVESFGVSAKLFCIKTYGSIKRLFSSLFKSKDIQVNPI